MKPSNSVSRHANRRSNERWGIGITVDEVERQLAAGEAVIYEKQNPVIWKILLSVGDEKIPLVYNSRLKTVITVLPREELSSIQLDVGTGISKEERREFVDRLSAWQKKQYEKWNDWQSLSDPNYNSGTVRRAQRRMAIMDSFPKEVREIVHEYGLEIVFEFWSYGIKSANDIVILIEASRKAKSAFSKDLLPLFNHFGIGIEKKVFHLVTAARMEPAPTNPDQARYGVNRKKSVKANLLERS